MISREIADATLATFTQVAKAVMAGVQGGTCHLRILSGGQVTLEMPPIGGIEVALAEKVMADIMDVVTAKINGRYQSLVDGAAKDGDDALRLVTEKLKILDDSGLLKYIGEKWRFLTNTEAVVFDMLSGYPRTTPLQDGTAIVSISVRMAFRDNVTGTLTDVVRFEADSASLAVLIQGLTEMREIIETLERGMSGGNAQAGQEGSTLKG